MVRCACVLAVFVAVTCGRTAASGQTWGLDSGLSPFAQGAIAAAGIDVEMYGVETNAWEWRLASTLACHTSFRERRHDHIDCLNGVDWFFLSGVRGDAFYGVSMGSSNAADAIRGVWTPVETSFLDIRSLVFAVDESNLRGFVVYPDVRFPISGWVIDDTRVHFYEDRGGPGEIILAEYDGDLLAPGMLSLTRTFNAEKMSFGTVNVDAISD